MGEHPTGSTTNYHCIATSSSSVLPPSGSDHVPVHTTSSSHKQPRVCGIAKSDSKTSMRSLPFEVQDIPFQFPHWEDGDMSVHITAYRETHTYPSMQQRMKLGGGPGVAGGTIPLCSSCSHKKSGSQISGNLIKPKLVVLGYVGHRLYTGYPKPFQRRIMVRASCYVCSLVPRRIK